MNSSNYLLIIGFGVFFFLTACSTHSDSEMNIFRNQTGLFLWGGSPAADGAGLLFEVDDEVYGVPGVPSDYPGFFDDDVYSIQIEADFRLTGKETVRGWGVTFPEIEFLKIQKRE